MREEEEEWGVRCGEEGGERMGRRAQCITR